jgi:hypothetical protein
MTGLSAEYILKAAVKSLSQGKRRPHCFRAHVIGKGYVNDGSAAFDRADYLRQAVSAAQSEVDNMGYANDYYDNPPKGILFANWNNLPKGLDTILERAGFEVEWSDEWTTCEDCQRAFRTSPDSYCWKPSGKFVEEDINADLCLACIAELLKDKDMEEETEE